MSKRTYPKRKLIIDCDTGGDDAHALLMALHDNSVEILAITTVFGNASVDFTTRNTLRVLNVAQRLDIPVFSGCSQSLMGMELARYDSMDTDGLGGVTGYSPPTVYDKQHEHASLALLRLTNTYPGEITLVATGPLTNVAVALKLDPLLGKRIKEAFVMGGNIYGQGNATACAEFNFYADIEAAHIILNQLGCPITVITHEICKESGFSWKWYDEFASKSTKEAELLRDIFATTVENQKQKQAKKFILVWDQLCMAVALERSVARELKHVYSTIELCRGLTRGQMIVDWNNKLSKTPNISLVTKVDQNLFSRFMYQGANIKY